MAQRIYPFYCRWPFGEFPVWEYSGIVLLGCVLENICLHFLGSIPKSSIPGHRLCLFSSLVDNAWWFCIVLIPVYTFTRNAWAFWWFCFLFSTLYYLSYFSHFVECLVVLNCGFNLYLSGDSEGQHLFQCLLVIWIFPLWSAYFRSCSFSHWVDQLFPTDLENLFIYNGCKYFYIYYNMCIYNIHLCLL